MTGTGMQPAATLNKPLRADALRNRALIIEAARGVFAERGLEASLDDVARRAGVGVGTLYRRFPDREELIETIFEERIQEQVASLRVAAQVPDAWLGLSEFLRRACGELATDRGMRELFLGAARGWACMTRGRELLYPLISELVERAQRQGTLSEAFAPTDVPLVLLMMSSVGDFAGTIAPDLWRRYFDIFIAGLQARTAGLTPPLEPEQIERAINMRQPA